MSRRDLTIINPYYDNPNMFELQQTFWGTYSPELRKHLHAIVVDDASPRWPARPHVQEDFVHAIESFALYRTLIDVRWNWLFCRNLAASKAKTEWILMTDIDHVVPEATLRFVMETKLKPGCTYNFSRCNAPKMDPYKPHPNSWLMTREMFDRIGGYDERFSGFYGTDAEFRARVKLRAPIIMLDQMLVRYSREVLPDASTTTYGRKEPQDRDNVIRIRTERNVESGWTPKRLTFPWTSDYEC